MATVLHRGVCTIQRLCCNKHVGLGSELQVITSSYYLEKSRKLATAAADKTGREKLVILGKNISFLVMQYLLPLLIRNELSSQKVKG